MIVEICASNFESAKAAEDGGADRIELCEYLEIGGLTPSPKLIEKVLTKLSIPVHVLVRPRKGDFSYSEADWISVLESVEMCHELGCAGIVSGALSSDKSIDKERTGTLVEICKEMDFTFHRAFDQCRDPLAAFETLLFLGVDRLLSSGQELNAVDGIPLLKRLHVLSDNRMEIMPGSGIEPANVMHFKESGFHSVHLSAIKKTKPATSFFDTGVSGISDLQTIKEVVQIVH
ncbi:MAG: copper homeostasis protein CutC [Bacteroidia bacterium]|nr:copper homeostasis protein CutC [Bacteroidia bacterium]NNJ81875.1 copper homeostasis protein CutC [Flavobacteriaceae bacterium]